MSIILGVLDSVRKPVHQNGTTILHIHTFYIFDFYAWIHLVRLQKPRRRYFYRAHLKDNEKEEEFGFGLFDDDGTYGKSSFFFFKFV